MTPTHPNSPLAAPAEDMLIADDLELLSIEDLSAAGGMVEPLKGNCFGTLGSAGCPACFGTLGSFT